ncbi:MAG TPA: SpoIIE family protein phosphatase [Flavobacteriales bacterium]|nr:SpoIIE family protein phosphatase [Flavobacteriales bacterium]
MAWVAVVLNPVWGIEDFFNIPLHFNDFFVFRISVAAATLVGILLRNKLKERPEIIAFIPFIGISIQNAYMYSVMNVTEIEKHTFAYIALFIGAGMFVLWKPLYSIIVVALSFVANIVFFSLNSQLQVGEVLINGGMLTASVAVFTILLINTRTNLTKKEIISRLALAKSNKELEEKNDIIEEKNKDIRDSINYAKRIQHAILPLPQHIASATTDYFVMYKPKDIIAGDFYWFETKEKLNADGSKNVEMLIAAADCTGHGVPGAMVSVVCSNALHRAVVEYNITEPGKVLDKVTDLVLETFGRSVSDVKDGMDISLLELKVHVKNGKKQILEANWAGANNPLWYLQNDTITEITADKQPIGKTDNRRPFTTHKIPFDNNTVFYLFTDGYTDQFGGPLGKKFKHKQLQKLLLTTINNGFESQHKTLDLEFERWKGALEQVDDVCVIGLKV